MAKINKQEIMQKLIDELNLYPGKDLIPSELADKILAVYQINAGEVLIENPVVNVVKTNNMHDTSGDTAVTIYTTPATGKFYLTGFTLSHAYVTGLSWSWIEVTIDGVAIKIGNGASLAATDLRNLTISFDNPILLDQGTVIALKRTTSNRGAVDGAIYGYTKD